MVLLICFYINVYHKCISSSLKTSYIPQNALSLIVHTVQRLNNTVYAPYRSRTILLTWTVPHWTLLYIHTDSHCTELNDMVPGFWNTLNSTKLNCNRVLIYTLCGNWNTLYKTEQHCTGALIYILQKLNNNTREHWSTFYKNWTIIHGSIDLHFTKPNNTLRGTDLNCVWWDFTLM